MRRVGGRRLAAPSALLAALLALPGCGAGPGAAPDGTLPPHPLNVLLVTFDALRADRLGVYGYGWDTSPVLDAFAQEATVFDDCLSQSGTTVLSLPSLHTGRFPVSDPIRAQGRLGLGEQETTLAEILAASGYDTAAVVGHVYAGSPYGLAQGFARFADPVDKNERADRTRERAEEMLAELESPFFLWVHFRPPHAPYQASDEFYARRYPSPPGIPTLHTHPFDEVLAWYEQREPARLYTYSGRRDRPLTVTMVDQVRALYDGGIRLADAELGRLLDALDGRGAAAETLVIVASDHGESMGEHGLIDHNTLWYGVLHTPLLVRVPGREGGRASYPVMNVDILPTVLARIGLPAPEGLRGRDLFDADRSRYAQIAEYENQRTIKLGHYQLIERAQPPAAELYDVVADPDESDDLAARLPDEVARGQRAWRALAGDAQLTEGSEDLDRLRALGYLE